MEHEGKNKSPYSGFWQCCVILLIVPLIIFALIYFAFDRFSSFSNELNIYSSIAIGFGTGFLFQLSCIIAGLFKGMFMVVVHRICTLFSDLRISRKIAIRIYIEDLKENGVVFWGYLLIILITLGISVFGIIKLCELLL